MRRSGDRVRAARGRPPRGRRRRRAPAARRRRHRGATCARWHKGGCQTERIIVPSRICFPGLTLGSACEDSNDPQGFEWRIQGSISMIPASDFGPVGEGVTFLRRGNARGHVPGPGFTTPPTRNVGGLSPKTEPCEPISLSGTQPGTPHASNSRPGFGPGPLYPPS